MAPMAKLKDQRARLLYGYSKYRAGTLKKTDILYKWVEASIERYCCPGKYDKQKILIDTRFETRKNAKTMWPPRLNSQQGKTIETISLAMQKHIDQLEESCQDPAMDEEERAEHMGIVRAFRRMFAPKFGQDSGANQAAYDFQPLKILPSRGKSTIMHATAVFSAEEFKALSDFYLRTNCFASGTVETTTAGEPEDSLASDFKGGAQEV